MTTADSFLDGSDRAARLGAAQRGDRLPLPVFFYMMTILIPVSIQAGPVLLTSVRAFLLVMLAPLALGLVMGKYGKLLWTDWLFFAHFVWIPIALSNTTPDFAIGQAGSVGVEFLGGYLVGRAYIRDAGTFRALLKFLMIALLVLFPFSLLETLNGRPLLLDLMRKIPVLDAVNAVTIEKRLGLERVQAVFTHPIHYGLFASSIFSMVLIGLRDSLPLMLRLPMLGVIAASVFLSLSSGAILPVVMQVGLFVWATALDRVKSRWLILVALSALAYVTIDLLSNRTPMRVFMSYATFSPHNAYWRGIIFDWGFDNIMGNAARGIEPARLFGIGMADWVRPHFMFSGSMDNFWLVMGVRYGIPGFLTVALGWGLLMWRVGTTPLDHLPQIHALRRAWMFTFIGLTFTLATVHVWTAIYSYTFFLFGAGVWFLSAGGQGAPEGADDPEGGDPDDVESEGAGSRYARRHRRAGQASAPVYTRFARERRV